MLEDRIIQIYRRTVFWSSPFGKKANWKYTAQGLSPTDEKEREEAKGIYAKYEINRNSITKSYG